MKIIKTIQREFFKWCLRRSATRHAVNISIGRVLA
jgi:hypothetical protein